MSKAQNAIQIEVSYTPKQKLPDGSTLYTQSYVKWMLKLWDDVARHKMKLGHTY